MIQHSLEENIYLKRIEKFLSRLKNLRVNELNILDARFAHCIDSVPFSQREELEYRTISEGFVWGQAWESGWFHLNFEIPKHWQGEPVLELDINGEALIFDDSGNAIQGISNNSVYVVDGKRDILRLTGYEAGQRVSLWLEAGAYSLCGINLNEDPDDKMPQRYGSYQGEVKRLRLLEWNQDIWLLYLDMELAYNLLTGLEPDSVRRSCLLQRLNAVIDTFAENTANVTVCRDMLSDEMKKPANTSDLTVYAVGHAHLDTAWLWPVKETIRKCARSFATQLQLMKRYPDYVFGASQPQHYQFIKDNYPKMYQEIRERIKEGRWECQGGMWVEADCNLISGESMVRQFLYGQHFYLDEFDLTVNNLWLPDVFGYSAALPQIMRNSGCEYLITQKISWNQVNEFPYNSFTWKGIDGSSVLTHFPPENDYNCSLKPESLIAGQKRFKEKGVAQEYLSLYGIGNGGGGPTEEQIERGLRQQNLEGSPKVKLTPATDFLQRLSQHQDSLPVWEGELYLEMHRGTYTSQAKVKRLNRTLEIKLRSLEMLWSQLPLSQYPQQQLDNIWKKVLINQFHDIIPGSSINQVYKVTHSELDQLVIDIQLLENQAGAALLADKPGQLTLFNSLNQRFTGWVELAPELAGSALLTSTNSYPVMQRGNSWGAYVALPPLSWTEFEVTSKAQLDSSHDSLTLENAIMRYQFSNDGQLISAWDKIARRELIEKPANRLALYIDRPNSWDAWDVDPFYQDQFLTNASCQKVSKRVCGGVQLLEMEFVLGESKLTQQVSLSELSARLDFTTQVSWHEKHKMLRVHFPVLLQAAEASFDIQYGYAKRPTHTNTSWDSARFEVCAHKFADLSESQYGVALLNDCKYGYKLGSNELELTLLRSPTYPDPDCDQGDHSFTYSLLPHQGNMSQSNVQQQAWSLNVQPLVFVGKGDAQKSLNVQLQSEGINLACLKKAHKSDGLIVRVVEEKGAQSKGILGFSHPVTVAQSNLIETEIGQASALTTILDIELKPFEIKTFLLTRN